jgi:cell division septum initiation protein DivIVA
MLSPTEIISDIQSRLDRVVRDYHHLLERNQQLEQENTSLANSLKEAVKQQELLQQKLDTIRQDTLKETKGIDQWKSETRKEIRNLMKEVEKCIPQVESMLEKK